MKRLLSLVILIFLVSLLIGCNGVVPPPPEEPEEPSQETLQLIIDYTDQLKVSRWGNGTVLVKENSYTQEIWEEINQIIDGPVVFKMTSGSDAQIEVVTLDIGQDGFFFVGFSNYDNFQFNSCVIYMNPAYENLEKNIYVAAILMACGINEDKAKEGLTNNMKTALYWLYRLEPGTFLL